MFDAVIIGAGPAGLMAADHLSSLGCSVVVVEQMPSPARKFLMAGRGGLNLTHSEDLNHFLARYREAEPFLAPIIESFPPDELRQWCHELGQETFVGTSGRVFPKAMKASPLLRALLRRLDERGVQIRLKTRVTDLPEPGKVKAMTDEGVEVTLEGKTVLWSVGGGSWPKLGSNTDWVPVLEKLGLAYRAFRPANCGFVIPWSEYLKSKFAGTPLKRIRLSLGEQSRMGEAILSEAGLEGGVVYALSAEIRDRIEQEGSAVLSLDLRPDLSREDLFRRLASGPGKKSLSSFLKAKAGLTSAEIALLHEGGEVLSKQADALTERIKALPITATAPYSLERAISSAGGIALDQLDEGLMVKALPGLFLAGEMLDWEAPTGGYLLQACFAMGKCAARSMKTYMDTLDNKEGSQ